jgi:hypothetical protein
MATANLRNLTTISHKIRTSSTTSQEDVGVNPQIDVIIRTEETGTNSTFLERATYVHNSQEMMRIENMNYLDDEVIPRVNLGLEFLKEYEDGSRISPESCICYGNERGLHVTAISIIKNVFSIGNTIMTEKLTLYVQWLIRRCIMIIHEFCELYKSDLRIITSIENTTYCGICAGEMPIQITAAGSGGTWMISEVTVAIDVMLLLHVVTCDQHLNKIIFS